MRIPGIERIETSVPQITEKFVSRKPSVVAFTRITFSAPSAFPAIIQLLPKSTYRTAEGKMICTVLANVTCTPWG